MSRQTPPRVASGMDGDPTVSRLDGRIDATMISSLPVSAVDTKHESFRRHFAQARIDHDALVRGRLMSGHPSIGSDFGKGLTPGARHFAPSWTTGDL